jgi:MFS family permease
MVGVLGWSFLAERIGVRLTLGVNLAMGAVGVFILANVEAVLLAYFYSFFYGICFGGQMALFPLAWADYFGRESLGTIRGLSRPITMVFNALGPFLAGWLYGRTTNYQSTFQIFIASYVLGSILVFISRSPHSSEDPGSTERV